MGIAMQFAGCRDKRFAALSFEIRLPAFAFAALSTDAVPRALKLGNGHRLVEFANRAEYLADEFGCRSIVEERRRAVGGYKGNAEIAKHCKADFLNHQVASEAARSLDDDSPDAIPGDGASMAEKPGRASIASPPLTAGS